MYGFFLCLPVEAISQTTLSAGDIAILQYNADDPLKKIRFLALRSMEAGTEINFTDKGWSNNPFTMGFQGGEGIDTWTASDNIRCGDIVVVELINVSLGTGGDQLFAFQGAENSPNFLFGLNNEGTVWQVDATNQRNSALPNGLVNGETALALPERDNAKYIGAVTGSRGQILEEISNQANWLMSDFLILEFTGNFTSTITWNGVTWWNGVTGFPGTPENYFEAVLSQDLRTSEDGSFSTCECTIAAGKTLTIASNDVVVVENSITNRGAVVIFNKGALVQKTKDAGNSGDGTYTVTRKSSTMNSEFDYTYWSSPLSESKLSNANVFQGAYAYSFDSGGGGSWQPESVGAPMIPGKGYATTGPSTNDYPRTYRGEVSGSKPNNGHIEVAISTSSGNFNLLGNPYPSAIDASVFVAENEDLMGTLYFWSHATPLTNGVYSENDYATWNASGGIGNCGIGCIEGDGNIASGQGFFVATGSGSDSKAVFDNTMRIAEPNKNANFFKRSAKSTTVEKNRIWLDLQSDSHYSQILVGFFDEATDGVDRLYDGLRFASGSTISFYSLLDDEHYAILGNSTLKTNEVIPLGFDATSPGDFKIAIHQLEGVLKNAEIQIKDNDTHTIQDLTEQAYSFSCDVAGSYEDRFELLIASEGATTSLGTQRTAETVSANKIELSYFKDYLQIVSSERIEEIECYDFLGRRIQREFTTVNAYEIKLNAIDSKEVLLLKVKLEGGKIMVRKIFI